MGLNSTTPYAVYAWLDVPINRSLGTDGRIQRRPWGFNYIFMLSTLPDNVTVSTPSGNMSLREWGFRVAEAKRRIFGNLTPLWVVDAGSQPFWRLLFVGVNASVHLRDLTLYNGAERGIVGIWAWLSPPDQERCFVGGASVSCGAADVTNKTGVLKYEVENGTLEWARTSWEIFQYPARRS